MLARSMQIHKRAVLIGDRSSGHVNSAHYFWQPIGSWQGVEFGTEIAVSKVVMENGEELENRSVTPDVPCTPTPEELRARIDPCLDRAPAMARAAKNLICADLEREPAVWSAALRVAAFCRLRAAIRRAGRILRG